MNILLAIVGVVVIWAVFAYNRFVRLVAGTKEAWSGIDVQLKRRYDLIPNLINTVKGYAAHESATFDAVTKARSAAMGVQSPAGKDRVENVLSSSLKSVFAIAEAYPDLKANKNFLELQRELSDTEDKIQASRRIYNANARDLNTVVASFPSNLIAGIFKFSPIEFFELGSEATVAKDPIKVSI